MGLDLLDFSHGEEGFFQEREGSLVGFQVFGERSNHTPAQDDTCKVFG